jgi:hypothetical protein
MTGTLAQTIWDALHERLGSDLRAVVRYDATGYSSRNRADIDELYDDDEGQRIVDQSIITQLSQQDLSEHLKTGDLDAVVRVFGDAWILTWPDPLEGKSGVYVSIERGGDTASMADVEWCLQYLDEEIGPQVA